MLSEGVIRLCRVAPMVHHVEDQKSPAAIHAWLGRLVAERQALREAAADATTLERNRLEIARLQQRLSEALIREHAAA
jgi:hypothetical protein